MKDYVAQWFEIYRKHLEPTDIIFSVENNNRTELINCPHPTCDGVGALHSLAEKYNWKIENKAPNRATKIGLFRYFYNCVMFLYWAHPRRKNIWEFEFNKSTTVETLHTGFSFSAVETTALLAKAKWLKVSLNTLLFYALNKCVADKFKLDKKRISWWIPVNMRPDLGLDVNDATLKKNYVSNFSLDLSTDTTLSDCQKLITQSLKQQKHWATWWWQHLGKLVPESVIETIAKRNLNDNFYVGAFSNIGNWTCKDQSANVSFYVTPLKSHPIGAAAIIWNGRLNITLRIYPTFPIKQDELDQLMACWAKSV